MTNEKPKKDEWAEPSEPPKCLWMSGEKVNWADATVHASMLGWSSISMVFEGIRGYWNPDQEQLNIFRLDSHLKRLMRSMKVMRMTSPWSVDELQSAVVDIAQTNEFHGDCYIQPLAYFGEGTPGYLSAGGRPGEVAIFSRESTSEMPIGNETVLLVEDEVAVRSLAARVLSDQGYTVLSASNGVEALRIADAMPLPEIDLLLTDVIMPIMGGKEVADRLTAMRPDLKVLFTSGYTDDTIARQGILKPGTAFTHKPFSPTELAAKVRQVLDSPLPAQAHERA